MQNKKLFRVTIVGMIVTYTVLAIGFRLTTSSASSSKMTSVVSDVKTLIGVAHGYANATSGQMGGTYLGLTSIVSGDYPAPGLLPKSYTKSGIPNMFGGFGSLSTDSNPYQYKIVESRIPEAACAKIIPVIRAWSVTATCSGGSLVVIGQ